MGTRAAPPGESSPKCLSTIPVEQNTNDDWTGGNTPDQATGTGFAPVTTQTFGKCRPISPVFASALLTTIPRPSFRWWPSRRDPSDLQFVPEKSSMGCGDALHMRNILFSSWLHCCVRLVWGSLGGCAENIFAERGCRRERVG